MLKDMEAKEIQEALERVSLKDKDTLKNYLLDSGRRYMIFNSVHLVDALSFPTGIAMLQTIIHQYKEHRNTIPTGNYRSEKNPVDSQFVSVPIMLEDKFNLDEMKDLVKFLLNKITDMDPSFRIE